MNNTYQFASHEARLNRFWEERGYFVADADVKAKKDAFSIILPPPNANADLHLGHAMYVYEDVMIRYHKIAGHPVLWLPGADHAGIETQFVYEKHLKKQGKSRFDFDRETLYKDIWAFVMENREHMENQLRRLGFALDWSKKKFTMDEDIVEIVHRTFKRLFDDGLVYRANRLVQYCTSCGTSFSDLEITDKAIEGFLYHLSYALEDGSGSITVATTRPETLFGDVAVMVHPNDKRYSSLVGKNVKLPLTDRHIPIIADSYVDSSFGTGAVKVTPAHDMNDFEVGKRHGLPSPVILDFGGKMQNTGIVDGIYVTKARKIVIEKLTETGILTKTVPHAMTVGTCYRCGTVLEPLPKEQWFINVQPLKEKAIQMVQDDVIKVHPKRFKKQLISILDTFIDWNISRQIVWGIRIPAFFDTQNNRWIVELDPKKQQELIQSGTVTWDTDTFDTWFSSAQWPFATLQSISEEHFNTFYPTTVMETGYDILRAWVSRMIMMGYYQTGNPPFEHIFLHGMVRDKQGQKMSKSKANVINPLDMIDKYGADALRAALIFGTKEGGDVVLSEDKIRAMRNFCNKVWNIARFIHLYKTQEKELGSKETTEEDIKKIRAMKKELASISKKYHSHVKRFELAKAFDLVYDFTWHRFADFYIEELKEALQRGSIEVLTEMETAGQELLRMLHPYVPFVTEAIWQEWYSQESSILD